jgi:pimeloyl-ACP methyl ester carboxylesterase
MDAPSFRFLDVDGARIAYWTLGNGPPLVITPGSQISDTQAEWDLAPSRAYCQALAETWTVVRYDQRGAGRSERRPSKMTAEDHVADLAAIVEAVGMPVTLLAQIWFGAHGLRYAARNPDRLKSLLLWNPTTHGLGLVEQSREASGWFGMASGDWETFIRVMIPAIQRVPREHEEEMIRWETASNDQAGFFRFYEESLFDARPDATRVTVPTRVLLRPGCPILEVD